MSHSKGVTELQQNLQPNLDYNESQNHQPESAERSMLPPPPPHVPAKLSLPEMTG